MDREIPILILEDDPTYAAFIDNILHEGGLVFSSKVVYTREAFLRELEEFSPAIILSDYYLPSSFDGLAALKIAQEKCPDLPFIFVTGVLGEETAIETIKKGATDFVLKNNLTRLVPVIHRALEEATYRKKLKQTEDALRCSEMRYRRLFEAAKDGIILLNAETGQIEDINPFLMDMLGYTYDEFLGKKLWEIGSFKNIDKTKRLFRDLQEKKYMRYEHLPLERKDGKQIDIECIFCVYPVDHKQIIQCDIRDISDRKKAEKEIKKRIKELEDFYDMALNRELKMIELKEEIKELKDKLIQSEKL